MALLPDGRRRCRASLDTLGADINVDRATVMRSIKKLCELGYLADQTPGRRNAPHTYTLLKSVAECNSPARNDMATHNETVAHDNTPKQTVADSNATVAECNATVAESHLKRVFKIDSKKEDKEGETPLFELLTQALAKICKINLEAIGRSTGKELLATQDAFSRIGITPTQVLEFDQWRKAHHWSGLKGNGPPSLKQVGEFWGQYEEWVKSGRPEAPAQSTNGANHGTHQRSNRGNIRALEETGESLKGKRTIDIYSNEYVYPDGHREPVPPVPRVRRPGILPA